MTDWGGTASIPCQLGAYSAATIRGTISAAADGFCPRDWGAEPQEVAISRTCAPYRCHAQRR